MTVAYVYETISTNARIDQVSWNSRKSIVRIVALYSVSLLEFSPDS